MALLSVLFVGLFLSTSKPVIGDQFIPPPNENCACRGEALDYICMSDTGAAAAVWNGSAFACINNGNRIELLRSSGVNTTATCNDGTISGRVVNSDANNFTTALTVNVSSGLNNSSISCSVTSDEGLVTVGASIIIVIAGPYLQVPNITIAEINASTLTFSWPSVDPACSAISYEMTTSGCGSCSIATDTATATATCTGLQLGSMCIFSVRSVICGFIGMPSNTVTVPLKVPDPPQVAIIPVYSADTDSLAKLFITIYRATGGVTDPLFGNITEYITSYSGSMQRNTSCTDNQCEYEVRGPFQDCATSTSSIINVAVSASNAFGQGNASMPQSFGCTNQFVRVTYTSSVITCTFLNSLDTSEKSCTVMYGSCDRELDKRRSANSTVDRPNSIEIQLDSSITSLDCFMYFVTANNGTVAVIVEETRSTQSGTPSQLVVIAVVPIVTVLVIVIIVVVVIIIVINARRKPPPAQTVNLDVNEECHQPTKHYRDREYTYLDKVHPHLREQNNEGVTEASETKAP